MSKSDFSKIILCTCGAICMLAVFSLASGHLFTPLLPFVIATPIGLYSHYFTKPHKTKNNKIDDNENDA